MRICAPNTLATYGYACTYELYDPGKLTCSKFNHACLGHVVQDITTCVHIVYSVSALVHLYELIVPLLAMTMQPHLRYDLGYGYHIHQNKNILI
jgi:hypothetical protein